MYAKQAFRALAPEFFLVVAILLVGAFDWKTPWPVLIGILLIALYLAVEQVYGMLGMQAHTMVKGEKYLFEDREVEFLGESLGEVIDGQSPITRFVLTRTGWGFKDVETGLPLVLKDYVVKFHVKALEGETDD